MAIDTEAKRFRIMDFLVPAGAPGIPTPPGGTVDAGERAALLWLYLATTAPVGPAILAAPALGGIDQSPSLQGIDQAPSLRGLDATDDLSGRVG